MRQRIEQYIEKWKGRGYPEDIPDCVPDALMHDGLAPSYRAIAIAILKNDHHLTELGFSAPKSVWYGVLKRIELEERKLKTHTKMANEEGEFLSYWGSNNEWRVYRRSDGFLVGYRSKLNKDGEKIGIDRVVTVAKTLLEFGAHVDGQRPKVKRYNPNKDPLQTRIE